MSDRLLVALAQLNPVMGDISGNVAKLLAAWREAARRGADLLITSELYVTGYPPEDFVLKPRVRKAVREAVESLMRETASGPAILLGAPWEEEGKLYNAALLLDGGGIAGIAYKYDLPNYGVFDEKRIFVPAAEPKVLAWRGHRLGVMLCEDMWKPGVAAKLKEQAAEILLVLNGSPFEPGKQYQRYDLARERMSETGLALVYVNQVGGQDELVFEGASFAMDARGELVTQATAWNEEIAYVNCLFDQTRYNLEPSSPAVLPEGEALTYGALCTGLRDYVVKNGFSSVLLGLSGGIDSALTAALAVDALGANKVRGVMMPSPYTSGESLDDAAAVAKALGMRLDTIPIAEAMGSFDHMLAEQFMGCSPDETEENIQARIRGVLLMALSNKSGSMVLATGNKSELAVGYATLYGDMCGGFAPLKDVYKTEVYKLAQWRNGAKLLQAMGPTGEVFSERLMTKAPTAELKPFQTDQDTLPPYDVLDDILKCLIEQDLGLAETTMVGHDPATVRRIYTMLDHAEYKRRQGAPGTKVTRRLMGRERRYPITNRYADKWRHSNTD